MYLYLCTVHEISPRCSWAHQFATCSWWHTWHLSPSLPEQSPQSWLAVTQPPGQVITVWQPYPCSGQQPCTSMHSWERTDCYPSYVRGTAHLDMPTHAPSLNHNIVSLRKTSMSQTDLASPDYSGPVLLSLMHRAWVSRHWYPFLALSQSSYTELHTVVWISSWMLQSAVKAHFWDVEGNCYSVSLWWDLLNYFLLLFDSPASHMHPWGEATQLTPRLKFSSATVPGVFLLPSKLVHDCHRAVSEWIYLLLIDHF